MRTRSYDEMRVDYGEYFEQEDEITRRELLAKYKWSVIVELDHLEHDNLEKWLRDTFSNQMVPSIYYGKTNYDFGFAEFFFESEEQMALTHAVVPRIYTSYPYPTWHASRTVGFDDSEKANPNDSTAIIFPPALD